MAVKEVVKETTEEQKVVNIASEIETLELALSAVDSLEGPHAESLVKVLEAKLDDALLTQNVAEVLDTISGLMAINAVKIDGVWLVKRAKFATAGSSDKADNPGNANDEARNGRKVQYKGKHYPTFAALTHELGITEEGVNQRVVLQKRNIEYTLV